MCQQEDFSVLSQQVSEFALALPGFARTHGNYTNNLSNGADSSEDEYWLPNGENNSSGDGTKVDVYDEEDQNYLNWLASLDAKNWKEQDHYRVLGLTKLRWAATLDQIRTAYRQKVLRHHPDKRRALNKPVLSADEDYFACITKAYEILGHTQKRRAFDSVDPKFDESIPNSVCTQEKFYETFGPIFESNARWSRIQPVPLLGDASTSIENVERFYAFWFDFDSWREFSYLDEEDKDKGENREERRWIDKQNKAMRDKRRKDEVRRIRKLVDTAHACDPRVLMYREEEKQRKDDIKRSRQEAKLQKKLEEDNARMQAEESARRVKEEAEEAERVKIEQEKREKDARKKALQKERKQLQAYFKDHSFYASNDEERIARMADVDKLCKSLSIDKLKELNAQLIGSSQNVAHILLILQQTLDQLQQRAEEEPTDKSGLTNKNPSAGVPDSKWLPDEVKLLIKAMTLFPVGTKQRWDVVAAFINEHLKQSADSTAGMGEGWKAKTGKDVVNQVKKLQQQEYAADAAAKAGAVTSLLTTKKDGVSVDAEPSSRIDTPAELAEQKPWTVEEQKLLEQALRTYSSAHSDRWDRVAECIPGRTKKECMKRFKELAELVRVKKAAQEQVQAQNIVQRGGKLK